MKTLVDVDLCLLFQAVLYLCAIEDADYKREKVQHKITTSPVTTPLLHCSGFVFIIHYIFSRFFTCLLVSFLCVFLFDCGGVVCLWVCLCC